MKVGELIEMLEEIDEEAEVRLALQLRSPMEYIAGSVAEVQADNDGSGAPVVYLERGRQLGYCSGLAESELGWRER